MFPSPPQTWETVIHPSSLGFQCLVHCIPKGSILILLCHWLLVCKAQPYWCFRSTRPFYCQLIVHCPNVLHFISLFLRSKHLDLLRASPWDLLQICLCLPILDSSVFFNKGDGFLFNFIKENTFQWIQLSFETIVIRIVATVSCYALLCTSHTTHVLALKKMQFERGTHKWQQKKSQIESPLSFIWGVEY